MKGETDKMLNQYRICLLPRFCQNIQPIWGKNQENEPVNETSETTVIPSKRKCKKIGTLFDDTCNQMIFWCYIFVLQPRKVTSQWWRVLENLYIITARQRRGVPCDSYLWCHWSVTSHVGTLHPSIPTLTIPGPSPLPSPYRVWHLQTCSL